MNLASKIQKFHYSKLHFSLLTLIFAPISVFYLLFILAKNSLYRIGILRENKAPIKIICVGNLTTGGVGKTPVVIELANYLAGIGEKPAVISRGYKGKLSKNKVSVIKGFDSVFIDSPNLSGDEPNLIAKSVHNTAVLVGSDRLKMAQKAEEIGATVVIMDDGFTNRKLYKDHTLLLFDYEKFTGNSFVLPLGPLREPMCEIKRADTVLIINKTGKDIFLNENLIKKLKYKDIDVVNVIPKYAINPKNSEILQDGAKVLAFTGIGSPSQFFNFLENKFEVLSKNVYDDHHNYTEQDIKYLVKNAKEIGAEALITTAKDYVKIKDLASELDIYILELKIDLNVEGILKWD